MLNGDTGVRALTVNVNPKSDLDMRYRAAVSDSVACLMPQVGLMLAGTHLVIYLCVCVLLARVSSRVL